MGKFITLFFICFINLVVSYEVTVAKLEGIYPHGLGVSILDNINEITTKSDSNAHSQNAPLSDLLNSNKEVKFQSVLKESQDPGFPCQLSVTEVSVPGLVCKGQLIFEENFNSALEKEKIWTPEMRFPGEPDYPFNVYMYEPWYDVNLKVKNGKLNIVPITLDSKYGEGAVKEYLDMTSLCTGQINTPECFRLVSGDEILPPIITAKVTTKQKFSFKYGRIEVRAKLPLGDWIIPEIQLEPLNNKYGNTNYASGILRIACVKGNVEFAKKLYGGPIMSESDPFRSAYLKEKEGLEFWAEDFHNYTVEWRPDGISMYVDGENYGNVSPGEGFYKEAVKNNVPSALHWFKGTVMAPFDEMFYIAIGLNVGGVHDFPDGRDKPWLNKATKAMLNFWNAKDKWFTTWFDDSSSLQVDYVKVYAI